MDILFRLSDKIEGFETFDLTKEFFKNEFVNDYGGLFVTHKRLKEFNKGDKMFITHSGSLVCVGVFDGYIATNKNETKGFNYGYRLKSTQCMEVALKVDFKLFAGGVGFRYIRTLEQLDMLNKIVSFNSDLKKFSF